MQEEKEFVFNYGEPDIFKLMDENNDIHIRYSVQLDHEVDANLIEEAWEKTKKVYPLIDCVPETVGRDWVFYKSNKVGKAVKSKAPIMPACDVAGERIITATYYKNTVTVSAYHSLVDGGGLTEVFKTFLNLYLGAYTGVKDENCGVQLKEGRSVSEYYKIFEEGDLGDFKQQPLFLYPYRRKFVEIDEWKRKDDGRRMFGSLKFNSDLFMDFCKKNGANPSSMLCYILSRACYKVHPDERRDVGFSMTVNARKVMGLKKYISNCLSMAVTSLTYDEAMNGKIEDAVKKVRAEIDSQRTPDYIKTFLRFGTTYGSWQHEHRWALVTYMGKLDVGVNTKHITNFEMATNAVSDLYMQDINGEFYLMFQFGKDTQTYINAVSEVLADMGIENKINCPAKLVVTDTETITE